jgi:hypothetical protein
MRSTLAAFAGAAALQICALSAMPAFAGDACADAATAMSAQNFDQALGLWADCASQAGQTPYGVARAHVARLAIFERKQHATGAEAELVALTTAPISTYPVFTAQAASPMGVMLGAKGDSVGLTQASLFVRRALYRAQANDFAASVAATETALRLAAAEAPPNLVDLGAAYAMRGKARYFLKDQGAVGDVVRAFVRGSKDEWVVAQMQKFPAEAQGAIEDMQAVYVASAAKWALANSVLGDGDAAARAKSVAEAKTTMSAVEAKETELVGPANAPPVP